MAKRDTVTKEQLKDYAVRYLNEQIEKLQAAVRRIEKLPKSGRPARRTMITTTVGTTAPKKAHWTKTPEGAKNWARIQAKGRKVAFGG